MKQFEERLERLEKLSDDIRNPEITLESAIEFIADDELVEVTPENIRIRKRILSESDRRRQRKR